MDIRQYNRAAWDRQVTNGDRWTRGVGSDVIAAARAGRWEIVLTPTKPVPCAWLMPLIGRDVLCLASGGGQQGPVLAAAGARVTVFDNSPKQLEQDRLVAERDGLALTTIEGDMADLSVFADSSFDLIVHPVSNLFVPDVRPVWREAYRVLRAGGALLAGFVNPAVFIFDQRLADAGELRVKYVLPYADVTNLSAEERQRLIDEGAPMRFSHSFADQLGGQLEAGFVLAGFYEDILPGDTVSTYMPTQLATRALKP